MAGELTLSIGRSLFLGVAVLAFLDTLEQALEGVSLVAGEPASEVCGWGAFLVVAVLGSLDALEQELECLALVGTGDEGAGLFWSSLVGRATGAGVEEIEPVLRFCSEDGT